MKLNKKVASVIASTLLVFSMGGCQQKEEELENNENEIVEEYTEENQDWMSNIELLEYEYMVLMELFEQVLAIMENCEEVGAEKSKELLINIQENKKEPTQELTKKYDDLLDKLITLAYLYITADDEGKNEIKVYVNGIASSMKQLDRELEKIMNGTQEF